MNLCVSLPLGCIRLDTVFFFLFSFTLETRREQDTEAMARYKTKSKRGTSKLEGYSLDMVGSANRIGGLVVVVVVVVACPNGPRGCCIPWLTTARHGRRMAQCGRHRSWVIAIRPETNCTGFFKPASRGTRAPGGQGHRRTRCTLSQQSQRRASALQRANPRKDSSISSAPRSAGAGAARGEKPSASLPLSLPSPGARGTPRHIIVSAIWPSALAPAAYGRQQREHYRRIRRLPARSLKRSRKINAHR